MPFRAQHFTMNEGMRIRGCFSTPEGVREQKPWCSTGLEYCLSLPPPVNVLYYLFGAYVKYGVIIGLWHRNSFGWTQAIRFLCPLTARSNNGVNKRAACGFS